MKNFRKIFRVAAWAVLAIFVAANVILLSGRTQSGRPYMVEIDRLARAIGERGFEGVDLSHCRYVENVVQSGSRFPEEGFYEDTDCDYQVRVVDGKIYRFDYMYQANQGQRRMIFTVNIILAVMSLLLLGILLFVQRKILTPFAELSELPYELSKGNLTVPIKENKYRFFGRFVWGLNVLRENLEQRKQRELSLLREKKTLVISLSHDIKTPLSAIKLYAKALTRGLYGEREKQLEIFDSIGEKADEIERFLSQIIEASSEDFLNFEVRQGEFHLSELVQAVSAYYREKLDIMKISFSVGEYTDCLLKGDLDRSVEVLQNIVENAVKYGDGHEIALSFSREEDCRLLTVRNTGCTLAQTELPHIFESFIRGTNAESVNGSGLGLYICRQLMHKMQGEVFAEIKEGQMYVTVIFSS